MIYPTFIKNGILDILLTKIIGQNWKALTTFCVFFRFKSHFALGCASFFLTYPNPVMLTTRSTEIILEKFTAQGAKFSLLTFLQHTTNAYLNQRTSPSGGGDLALLPWPRSAPRGGSSWRPRALGRRRSGPARGRWWGGGAVFRSRPGWMWRWGRGLWFHGGLRFLIVIAAAEVVLVQFTLIFILGKEQRDEIQPSLMS